MGGERTSPILVSKSIQAKRIITNEYKAFEDQGNAMYYLDLTITYRANKKRYSGVWALQIKNVLGSPMDEGYSYNYRTNSVEPSKSVVVLPVLSYKVEF